MNINRKTLTAGILLIAACSLQATTRTSLLQQNADVRFQVSGTADVAAAVKNTSFANLWNDPQFQNALGEHDLEKTIKEAMSDGMSEEQAHIYWQEIKMLKGFVGISFNIRKKRMSLVAEMSPEDFKRSIEMDRRLAELSKKDGSKSVIHKETWQGVDIYAELHPDKDGEDNWQACIDSTLLMSNSKDWLKKSIAAIKRSPISDKKPPVPFVSLQANLDSLIGYAIEQAEKSLKELQQSMPPRDGAPPEPQVSPKKIADATGALTLKNFSMTITFNKASMTIDASTDITKPLKGIFAVYDLTPVSTALQVPYAPADTISYGVSRLNLAKLWEQLPQIINAAAPPEAAQQMNAMLMGMSMQLGIDPGPDLFANLDTQYVQLSFDGAQAPEGLYLLRLKNEAGVKAALQKIFAENGIIRMQLNDSFKQEQLRNSVMYEFSRPEPEEATALTAEAGWLVFGPVSAVRQYLLAINSNSPANKAFYSSQLYRQLRRETPSL